MHFLVELTCIGKHTVEARFHVQPENRPAEPADVGEHVEMRQRCLERLVSSPRQSCHRTVFAVGFGAERTVYHRDEVFQNNIIKSCAIQSPLFVYILSGTRLERSFHISAIHHHEHRHTLTGCNQIVHNMIHLSLSAPAGFIFTHAMLQIQYRIALLRMNFILCRCVHHATTELFLRFGVIRTGTNLPVRYLLRTIIIPLLTFRDFDATCHTAATEERIAGRICYRHPVCNQEIIMESYRQRVGRCRPESSGIFPHIILLSATIHL